MGQVLHGSATTTEAIRRAIQHSQESLRALARRYGVNPKTVAKWKARKSVSDLRTGPKEPRSTVLSVEEEAVVVAFRRHTLLPIRPAAVRPASDALVPTPMSAAPRDLSAAAGRRRSLRQAQIQGLVSYRHRRSSNRRIAAVPYKVHTVLTDNGTHFTTPGNTSSAAPDIKAALDAGEPV